VLEFNRLIIANRSIATLEQATLLLPV